MRGINYQSKIRPMPFAIGCLGKSWDTMLAARQPFGVEGGAASTTKAVVTAKGTPPVG